MFETELKMSKRFEGYLKSNFGNSYLKEYEGLFGVPDFIFYDNKADETAIVAFELKLKDWRRAAKQAFRYKSFSNSSYVVLCEQSIECAVANIDFFRKYNIGLAKFNTSDCFEIIFKPVPSEPYSPCLKNKLVKKVETSRKKSKNTQFLIS